jgi:hypothetical protein
MVLPARMYSRDPADIVADDQLHQLGCRACVHAVSALERWYCSDDRAVKFHKRVPHVGVNCKFFELKG